MLDLGISNKDLVGKFGSKGYISSMLNGKKPLSLPLIKWFNKELGIPAEILLQ
jgi:HTH-type transcriptional regulator/antitoxin HigA